MAFILARNRKGSPDTLAASFDRYRAYVERRRADFPPSAFTLATSEWYFSLSDPRSPHDGWLEQLEILETNREGDGGETTTGIRVRLLNAYQDRYLHFVYPRVVAYRLDLNRGALGHRDWRYDEFRLSDEGNLIHEIEWFGPTCVGRWIITSSDVILTHSDK